MAVCVALIPCRQFNSQIRELMQSLSITLQYIHDWTVLQCNSHALSYKVYSSICMNSSLIIRGL